jgi:hypothetical protein
MDRYQCEGAAGTAPFETTHRVEIITQRIHRANVRADDRGFRSDLLRSLRIDLSDIARARLLGAVAELRALEQMSPRSARELRALLERSA